MSREQEMQEKKRRRAERWYRSLTPEQRAEIEEVQADPWAHEWICQLYRDGLIDENLELTGAGELKLHQLELRKWIAEHPRESRR
jgi:hypothetical protein